MEDKINVGYQNVNLKKSKHTISTIHPNNVIYYEYFKNLKKRAAIQGNTNLVIAFKKIIRSIFKYPLPIQSCLDANKLMGVGKGFSYHFDRAVSQFNKSQSLYNVTPKAEVQNNQQINEHINKVIRNVNLLLKDLKASRNIPIKQEGPTEEETLLENLSILDKEMLGDKKKKKAKQNIENNSQGNNNNNNNNNASLSDSAEDTNHSVDETGKCFVFRRKEYEHMTDSLNTSLSRKRKEVELNDIEVNILLVLYDHADSDEDNSAMSKEEIQTELVRRGKRDLCVNYKSVNRLTNMGIISKVEIMHCNNVETSLVGTKKKLKVINKLQLTKIGKKFVSKEKEKMAQMEMVSKGTVQENLLEHSETYNAKEEKIDLDKNNKIDDKDHLSNYHISVYDYESKFMKENENVCSTIIEETNTYSVNDYREYDVVLNDRIQFEHEKTASCKDIKESMDTLEKETLKENDKIVEDSLYCQDDKRMDIEEKEYETKDYYNINKPMNASNTLHNNTHYSLDLSVSSMVSKLLQEVNKAPSNKRTSKKKISKEDSKEIKTKSNPEAIDEIIEVSELPNSDESGKMIKSTKKKEKRKRKSQEPNKATKKKKINEKEKRTTIVSYGPFEIIMVIDNRDISGVHVDYYDKMKKVFAERNVKFTTRNLPLGDVIWLCRRRIYEQTIDANNVSAEKSENSFNEFCNHAKERVPENYDKKSVKYEEYVLKWVIERKTLNDLSSSIMDGRYDEQKYRLMRMKPSSHIIYLIENSDNSLRNYTSSSKIPYESLVKAMSSIQFTTGFSILRSQSMKHTLLLLSDMHYRIIKILREYCGIETLGMDDIFPYNIHLEEYVYSEATSWDIWYNDSKKSKNDLVKEVFGKQLRILTNCGPTATELILSLWSTPFQLHQALNEHTHDGILANRLKKIYLKEKELEGKKVKTPINTQLIAQLRRLYAPNTLSYNN